METASAVSGIMGRQLPLPFTIALSHNSKPTCLQRQMMGVNKHRNTYCLRAKKTLKRRSRRCADVQQVPVRFLAFSSLWTCYSPRLAGWQTRRQWPTKKRGIPTGRWSFFHSCGPATGAALRVIPPDFELEFCSSSGEPAQVGETSHEWAKKKKRIRKFETKVLNKHKTGFS